MVSENIKFQALTNHYKDSFEILQSKIRQREKLFLTVLCILTIMLFRFYTPQEALKIISQLISSHLNINAQINFLFIESVIWFSLLAITVKYFQTVVYIERQYEYIHKLEEEISKKYKNKVFTREGLSYLKNYPIFLKWTSFLYTVFFPILLVLIAVLKIGNEMQTSGFSSILFWINGIFCLFILIAALLYLRTIHCKK